MKFFESKSTVFGSKMFDLHRKFSKIKKFFTEISIEILTPAAKNMVRAVRLIIFEANLPKIPFWFKIIVFHHEIPFLTAR